MSYLTDKTGEDTWGEDLTETDPQLNTLHYQVTMKMMEKVMHTDSVEIPDDEQLTDNDQSAIYYVCGYLVHTLFLDSLGTSKQVHGASFLDFVRSWTEIVD